MSKPIGDYEEIRQWINILYKTSKKAAKEAEKLVWDQDEEDTGYEPSEHINPLKRDYLGIKNEVHRAIFILIKSQALSDLAISRVMRVDRKTVLKIGRIYEL